MQLRKLFQFRRSVLLDLYTERDSHDGKTLAAYRKGNYKIISGSYKDSHWYLEPDRDCVNSSDKGFLVRFYGKKLFK